MKIPHCQEWPNLEIKFRLDIRKVINHRNNVAVRQQIYGFGHPYGPEVIIKMSAYIFAELGEQAGTGIGQLFVELETAERHFPAFNGQCLMAI